MVSALDSRSGGPGFKPWPENCVAFLGSYWHGASLSTQVYKGVLVNLMLGVTLRCTHIPSSAE